MKFMIANLLISLNLIGFIISFNLLRDKKNNNPVNYEIDNNFKLPNGPIFCLGWFKFTNFEKNSPIKPNEFVKNIEFSEQFKENKLVNLKAEDDIGFLNIPDEDYHFTILTEKTLNFVTSRKTETAKTIEVIKLEEIIPLTSKTLFKGGITNHGDFIEGFCFQISTKKDNKDIVWELCTNSKKTKIDFMNSIVKLIKKNREKTSINNAKDKETHQNPSDSISKNQLNHINTVMNNLRKGISKETLEKIKNAKQPTWIAITQWSQCSKPCGGGKTHLQRICIVPKDSKGHCEGDRIIARECNTHSCFSGQEKNITTTYNNNNNTTGNKNLEDNDILNIEIKKEHNFLENLNNKEISKNKYKRCVIKEGDLSIYINDGYLKGKKIPVRVVLNNSSLIVYSSDSYESLIVSHKLSAITGLRDYIKEQSKSCFEIEEKAKKTILCGYHPAEDMNLQSISNEWQKNILDFIKHCSEFYSHELDFMNIPITNAESIKNTFEYYQAKEQEETEKIILRTQQLALQALEKELKVENFIEKQEEEKEKLLDEEYEKKYEKIKNQKEIINQALENKKKQADLYANKQVVKKKIIQISEAVKRQVEKIRQDLKSRLLAKKKDEARKRELIKDKIESLKKDISQNLIRASKKGNYEECDPERPKHQIMNFCKANYEENSFKKSECLKQENFCYMCCESEYGDLHLELRDNCYSKCNDFYFFKVSFIHKIELTTYNELKSKSNNLKEEKDSAITQENEKNKDYSDPFNSSASKTIDSHFSSQQRNIHVKNEEAKFLGINGHMNFDVNGKDEILLARNNDKLGKKNTDNIAKNQNSILKMIEEEKKKELLMKIKEDLNFD